MARQFRELVLLLFHGDLSNDLGVDLSGVTATGGVTATETAGGTFTAGADLGAADGND